MCHAGPSRILTAMSARTHVRVAIVDDNRKFGEALSVLLELEPDVKVVALLEDGEAAVEHATGDQADIYLVDFRLPDMDGAETTRAILERRPDTSVIALSAAAAEPDVEALRQAGALECLSKDRDLEALVAMIRRAARRTSTAEA